LLDARRLNRLLAADPFLALSAIRESVDSTNDELRRLAAAGAPAGTVVLAERQDAGRGRHGRRWWSPPGGGLYFSVLFRPERTGAALTRWTVAAAVAVAEACREVAGVPVEIEWPNDLVWRGRKLAGVLTETRGGAGAAVDLICGIGINLLDAGEEAPPAVRARAVSLQRAAGGGMLEPERLVAAVLIGFVELGRQLDRGAWEAIAGRFERLAPRARGCEVRVREGEGPAYRGRTRGLAGDGALVIERDDGSVREVRMADAVTYQEG